MKMPKMDVEIVFTNRDSITKRCKVDGEKVIIDKGSKGRGNEGWMPSFTKDSIIDRKKGRIRKKTRKTVMVRFGADKCLEFQADKVTKIPSCDAETVERLFNAKVLKHAGQSTQNVKVPWYVTALLLVLVLLSVFQFAVSRGLINVR